MKVLTRSFAFLFLLICLRTTFADDDSSEEHDSSEEKEGSTKLEDICDDDSYKLTLGKLEESSKYFTFGEDHEELDECHLKIKGPSGYGLVMVVEQYHTEKDKQLDEKSLESGSSKVQVSYRYDDEDKEAIMPLLGNAKSDRSLSADVEYVLFSSKSNEIEAIVENDGTYSYGLVITAVNLDDCLSDEEQCAVGISNVQEHCIWSNLTCDGHVNCAVTPRPPDEYKCDSGKTFNGVVADDYYYYWSGSVLLFALIIIPIVGLVLVAIVLICVCMRKVYRRRQLRNMVRNQGHVNVITVSDWDKDEKLSLPPEYKTIEELPPAYHTLFLPSTNMAHANEAYNQPPPAALDATEDEQKNQQHSQA